MTRKKKTGSPGGGVLGKLFGFLLTLVVLAAAGAGGAWFYAQHVYTSAGPATADGAVRSVMIEPGSSVPVISEKLEAAGAIEDGLPFRLAVRFTETGQKLQAGEYAIASGASIKDIIGQMTDGRVVLHGVTAAEGLTSAMIMRRLADEAILSGDLPSVEPAEGVLLPETYMVHRGETRQEVVSRMIKAQQKLLAELWPTRQPGLPFETPEQAIILASIVEKETGVASERPQVAAVFVNRMKRGIRLESDPTIIYGVCKVHPERCAEGKLVDDKGNRRVIRQSEIDLATGYNTYRIDGLPPTPICNPGRDSIAAVLNPPVSNALFFVADGTGGHVFAATYAEHQANVARWRKTEAAALAAESKAPASAPAPAPAKAPPKPPAQTPAQRPAKSPAPT